MASVFPFRALRPVPAVAAKVAAVPYDVVSAAEARALADGNPLSFLHVSRAEIDLPDATDPYAPQVYETALANFRRLEEAAPLVVEDQPSLYFYRLTWGGHGQTGLAATFSLDEYGRNIIKKHERTRRDKEDDRTRHIVALRAQTGPVFLTYRAAPDMDRLASAASALEPLTDFEAADGVRHTIWRVRAADLAAVEAAMGRIDALYIADGHHRAASAARARDELRARGEGGAADRMLAVAFPDDQVRILPYNRAVKDLGGRSPDQFVDEIRKKFHVSPGNSTPSRRGQVSMYVGGQWLSIDFTGGRPSGEPPLDVTVLQDELLAPVLGIVDVRTDKRIEFVGGIRGPRALEHLVNRGEAAAAFAMYPVAVADLMAVSDAGGIMPPKSTWFEPKLRDGLLIHTI